MSRRSTMYFPLRSNASALYAGPGVAGVRRRILTAALLHDRVILESGFHQSMAGPEGASSLTAHRVEGPARWQSAHARGRATGTRHYVAMRPSSSPETAPMHTMISTPATFSWRATFEPFRRELPASAARWLDFGHVEDEAPSKATVRQWTSQDRDDDFRRYRLGPRPEPAGGQFVANALIEAGYFDLATAAHAGVAASVDRRHRAAIQRRLAAGDASPIGGHYALELLLPTAFSWDDVVGLRRDKGIREFRAVMRDIEDLAMDQGETIAEIDSLIHREYRIRVAAATSKGLSFGGRVALTAVGFVGGVVADQAAPIVGGATVAATTFAVSEAAGRIMRPRWLSVDRRLGGPRTGL